MLATTNEGGELSVLSAFERLFDKAASKLNIDCTPEERATARQNFAQRFAEILNVLGEAGVSSVSPLVMKEMEAAIDELSPAHIAGYLAVGPLAVQLQQLMRTVALQAAEHRVLEHLISQADDTYGGN